MTELLKPTDVKRILRVSLSTVYALAERKQLPCIRWGCMPSATGKRVKSVVRFRPEDIQDFINRHRVGTR